MVDRERGSPGGEESRDIIDELLCTPPHMSSRLKLEWLDTSYFVMTGSALAGAALGIAINIGSQILFDQSINLSESLNANVTRVGIVIGACAGSLAAIAINIARIVSFEESLNSSYH